MPNVTIEELIARIDDQRRDDTDSAVDKNKKLRAITAILEIISARANFKFAIRKKRIDYLAGYTDYNLENVLGITDFKEIHQLRPDPEDGSFIDNVQENDFSYNFGRGSMKQEVTVQMIDGKPNLRINASSDKPKTQVNDMTAVTSNGTWSADTTGSDAANITADSLELENGAIVFDIDVSQNGANKATIKNSTMTSVDLSEFVSNGHHRMKADLPDGLITLLTSIELHFGSSATDYYSIVITGPADGNAFAEGINELDFAAADKTTAGSPNSAAITYGSITLNYGAGQADVSKVRFTDWWVVYPKKFNLYYFSTALVRSSAGAVQEEAQDTTDEIIIPRRHKETVVEGSLWQIMDQMGTDSGDDSLKHLKFFEYGQEYDAAKNTAKRFGGMRQMIREFGIAVPTEKRKLKVRHRPET